MNEIKKLIKKFEENDFSEPVKRGIKYFKVLLVIFAAFVAYYLIFIAMFLYAMGSTGNPKVLEQILFILTILTLGVVLFLIFTIIFLPICLLLGYLVHSLKD